jgi:FlaA1/EpsC-like NDP-sugar epimerase
MPHSQLNTPESLFRKYYKQALMLCIDTVLLVSAILFALWSRLGIVWFPPDPIDRLSLLVPVISTLFVFARLGLYRSIIRYMGQQAIFAVLQGVTMSALLVAITAFLTGGFMPRSVPVIYWGYATVLIGGSRLIIRAYYQKGVEIHKARVAIYGAGTSGLQVYNALLHGLEYKPAFFVDDNVAKQGRLIDGLHVYNPVRLLELTGRFGVTRVLLAMPSVPLYRRKEIMHDLQEQGIEVQMVPGVEDLLNGALNQGDDITRVYENVLGRDPVQPDESLLKRCIEGKVVMVTGAGGSIGGELCRQILLVRPKKLILIEASEYALYNIEKELMTEEYYEGLLDIEIVSLIANVQNKEQMSRIIATYHVQTIYHAAAYKHLPVVERNVIEGVRNNIFGTLSVAEAAVKNDVETFVLVSTDKAVRPSSVMGATKRCAEMICQSFNYHFPTRFCMVRFGNVLGSSGSVIPLFLEQINSGGPVTVTHPDVTRYFMTLREAAQLVLQAGSMGRGGDIFVLNMGQPIRIMDIATRMIQLMGYVPRDKDHPRGDIEIRITGMRAGEKLHEELLLGENVTGTNHPMILRAEEPGAEFVNLQSYLGKLAEACNKGDCAAIRNLLQEFVPEYQPSNELEDIVWRATASSMEATVVIPRRDNVEPLVRKPSK